MQGSSNKESSGKKRGAMIAAAIVVVVVALIIGAFLLIIKGGEDAALDWILWIYIGVLAAVIIGVIFALSQRLKEIRRGEEEAAKKY